MEGRRRVGEAEGVVVSEVAVNWSELVSLSSESSLSLSKMLSAGSFSVGVPLANWSPAVSARLAISGKEIDIFLLPINPAGGGLASSWTALSDFSSCCRSFCRPSASMYTVDSRGVTSGVSSDTSADSPLRELDERSEIIDKFRGILLMVRWVAVGSVRMLCM